MLPLHRRGHESVYLHSSNTLLVIAKDVFHVLGSIGYYTHAVSIDFRLKQTGSAAVHLCCQILISKAALFEGDSALLKAIVEAFQSLLEPQGSLRSELNQLVVLQKHVQELTALFILLDGGLAKLRHTAFELNLLVDVLMEIGRTRHSPLQFLPQICLLRDQGHLFLFDGLSKLLCFQYFGCFDSAGLLIVES